MKLFHFTATPTSLYYLQFTARIIETKLLQSSLFAPAAIILHRSFGSVAVFPVATIDKCSRSLHTLNHVHNHILFPTTGFNLWHLKQSKWNYLIF